MTKDKPLSEFFDATIYSPNKRTWEGTESIAKWYRTEKYKKVKIKNNSGD